MKLDSPSRFTSFYESFSDLIFGTMAIFVLLMLLFLALIKPTENAEELKKQLEAKASENQDLSKQIRDLESQNSDLESQNSNLESQNSDLRKKCGDLEEAKEKVRSCQAKIEKKFLLVLISWPGVRDDIDLHVVDPQGREFYYEKKTHAGSSAAIEEDSQSGPGNEIWLHPEAGPGTYRIYYKYYRQATPGTTVRGVIVHPEAKYQIESKTLTAQGQKILAAEVHVDQRGVLSVSSR
nr:hypothetical protein [Nitrosomonas nitrosa]